MSSVSSPCIRMYWKPHSRSATRNCSCQSARSPSLARPAPTHTLKEVSSGPWICFTSMAMIRSCALGPPSLDSPAAAVSPDNRPATAMVIVIVQRCDGLNEDDMVVIEGEWLRRLSSPIPNPNYFWIQIFFGRGLVPEADIIPAGFWFARAAGLADEFAAGRRSNGEVGVLRFHRFGRRGQHAGGNGRVGALLNQDERAGQPVGGVAIKHNRLGNLQPDDADVVDGQRRRFRFRLERSHVDAAFQTGHHGLRGLRE